jgi:large subunit ribosomal protein L3
MGGKMCTQQNLQVVKIDTVHNLLYIKGAIPGTDNAMVKITDAIKKGWYNKTFPANKQPIGNKRELLPVPADTVDPFSRVRKEPT